MKLRHAFGVAGTFLLATTMMIASADPIKELAIYKGNLGKWNCDVKDLGSGTAFKSVADFTVEFDGNTYIERYTEVSSADHPNPWKSLFIMSYDSEAQRWVRNGIDNSGGLNAATSSGWSNDTWVWENNALNIVIQSTGKNTRTFAVDVKDGTAVKRVAEASCKRI